MEQKIETMTSMINGEIKEAMRLFELSKEKQIYGQEYNAYNAQMMRIYGMINMLQILTEKKYSILNGYLEEVE